MFAQSFKCGGSDNIIMFIQQLHKMSFIDGFQGKGLAIHSPSEDQKAGTLKDSVKTFSWQL